MKEKAMLLKTIFIKVFTNPRFKSFYWRTGMMAISILATVWTNTLAELEIDGGVAVIVGLILGEVSKYLNSKYGNIKK